MPRPNHTLHLSDTRSNHHARKTWTHVAWVALFSTLAGLLYGFWIDGALWLG